jgi:hypothetical protein
VSDDSKIWRNSCIIGCVGCAGLIVLVIAVVAGMFLWGQRAMTPGAMEFLDAVEDGRYEEAHALMDGEWRAEHPLDEFVDEWEDRGERLGARQSIGSGGVSFNLGDDNTTSRARYSAQYEHGRANIEISLERREGAWALVDLRFTEIADLEPLDPPEQETE